MPSFKFKFGLKEVKHEVSDEKAFEKANSTRAMLNDLVGQAQAYNLIAPLMGEEKLEIPSTEFGKSTYSAEKLEDNNVVVKEHFEYHCECDENNAEHDIEYDHNDTVEVEGVSPQLFVDLVNETQDLKQAVTLLLTRKAAEIEMQAKAAIKDMIQQQKALEEEQSPSIAPAA